MKAAFRGSGRRRKTLSVRCTRSLRSCTSRPRRQVPLAGGCSCWRWGGGRKFVSRAERCAGEEAGDVIDAEYVDVDESKRRTESDW